MYAQIREPVDVAVDQVAADHRPDVFWRAAENDVARLEFERARQLRNLLGHAPDHLTEVRILLCPAVHLEPDRALGRVTAQLLDRMDGADGRRVVEALAYLPRLLLLAHAPLQIAARHVQPDRIAEHAVQRLLGRDFAPTLVQRRDQLAFIVVVLRQRRIGMISDLARRDVLDRVRRLLEEERRLACRIAAHLARMCGVVAADAVDAPHREALVTADDGDRG